MSAVLSTRAERAATYAVNGRTLHEERMPPQPRPAPAPAAPDRRTDVGRLVVVSNRLPIIIEAEEDSWRVRPSSGGLVTALTPVLRRASGLWFGWPGDSELDPGELARL